MGFVLGMIVRARKSTEEEQREDVKTGKLKIGRWDLASFSCLQFSCPLFLFGCWSRSFVQSHCPNRAFRLPAIRVILARSPKSAGRSPKSKVQSPKPRVCGRRQWVICGGSCAPGWRWRCWWPGAPSPEPPSAKQSRRLACLRNGSAHSTSTSIAAVPVVWMVAVLRVVS